MGNLLAELKRRHIYRVAAGYAVVAWIVLQIVNNVAPAFNLPGTGVMLVIVLLAAGFPIALVFAWVLELKAPETPAKTGAMDWILVAVALVFVGMFAYQQLASSRATVSAQPGVEAARTAAASPKGTISIAVLPFANMSGDATQEFFSDGMTEEITSALAKVPDLRVVARTSAFEFKGKNVNIKTMGEELGATHLIEGSVRKAGNRVRITVQLIKADDGTHIWAQDYDRELTDIFAIQEDIGRAITASLNMSLGLKPGENLVNNRAITSEDYQEYLRASAMILSRGGRAANTEAMKILEEVVARNPKYAPAWATLGGAYYFMVNTDPARTTGSGDAFRRIVETYIPKIEAAAKRALELDPNYLGGYGAMSLVQLERGNFLSADEWGNKAFALDPNDPRILQGRSIELAISGRIKDANAVREQLRAVEPFVPIWNRQTAQYLWVNGQNDAALAILNAMSPDVPARDADIARIFYASVGRFGEAADLLEKSRPGQGVVPQTLKDAVRLLRTAPASAADPQSLPRLGNFDWVYLYIGAPERALETLEYQLDSGFAGAAAIPQIWHSSYAPVRKTERFRAYVRKLGLVDYWRAKGWPESSHVWRRFRVHVKSE